MYNYDVQREFVFTDEGQRVFLTIRDRTEKLLKSSGAVRAGHILKTLSGSSWDLMACVDRLEEIGEIKRLNVRHKTSWTDRVFIDIR